MKSFLKAFTATILLIGMISIPHQQASAQIVKSVTIAAADDTLVNADTAYVTLTFDGSYKSVEAYVNNLSGTTTGKVWFQGEYPHAGGGTWADLDSLTISGDSYKLFVVPDPRTYKAYRFKFIAAGTQTAAILGYYVRYTGGFIRQKPSSEIFASLKFNEHYGRTFMHYDQKWFNVNRKKILYRRTEV